jgi:hypothetical protein
LNRPRCAAQNVAGLEILQQFAVSQIGASNEYSLQLPSVVAAEKTTTLAVQPPAYDDIGSDEDGEDGEDERPLTRQEILKRTTKDFLRKSGGATM